MLVQRFDGARAKATGIPWHFSHGCHMATQAIVSSCKKGRRQEEKKGGTFLLGKTVTF